MTKKLVILLLISSLPHLVSAQKITYTFDYQIDTKESEIYKDSIKFKNERYIKSTWLNSKDRSYVAMLRFEKDSSQNRLIVYDFNALEMYINYPNKSGNVIEIKPMETMGMNLTQISYPASIFPPLGRRKKIDGYSCRKIWETNASHSSETWFTKDILDAPEHSFHAVYLFYKYPPKYSGVVVDSYDDTPVSRSRKHLLAAQKNNHKMVIEANLIMELEGNLKTINP